MKKCAVLLAALLIFLNWPLTSSGEPESYTTGDFTYSLENGNATITGYLGSALQLAIPDILDGHAVVMIGDKAFSECDNLIAVSVPFGVTDIEQWAFYHCSGLTSIILPESLHNIGYYSFLGCSSLTDIILPESLVSLGKGSFSYCTKLADITIPAAVINIGGGTFDATGLHRIRVSKGNPVYTIREGILFDKTKKMLHTYLSDKKERSYEVPQGTQIIGELAFSRYDNLKSMKLPDSLTEIEESAFSNCTALTNLDVPRGVTSIGQWAFYNCVHLTSISFPDSLVNIGDQAFSHCKSLADILIPASVTSIGGGAFYDTALDKILVGDGNPVYEQTGGILFDKTLKLLHTYPCKRASGGYQIPQGILTIGKFAFYGCAGLTGITIPDSITVIESSAFSDCAGLTYVNLPDGIAKISGYAFYNCTTLTGIFIPSSVTNIENFAFDFCPNLVLTVIPGSYAQKFAEDNKLKYKTGEETAPEESTGAAALLVSGGFTYTMSDSGVIITGYTGPAEKLTVPGRMGSFSVTSIGDKAFWGCEKLVSVILPEGIKQIGEYAFSSCGNLKNIVIPQGVIGIGKNAFYACTGLTSINIPKSVLNIGSGAFCETSLETIRVEKGNPTYKLIDGVLFDKTQKMLHTYPCGRSDTTFSIPKENVIIGDWAFSNCKTLTKIVLPKGITVIGNNAFIKCTSLSNISLPDGVTDIGYWAFAYCESLSALKLPKSISRIGTNAFSYCTALTGISIPANVVNIGAGAFIGTPLKKIEVSDRNPVYAQISGILFDKKQKMLHSYPCGKTAADYIVPEGVISIGEWAFSRCGNLKTIILPSGLLNIGNEAFSYCENLASVNLPDSLTVIGTKAFTNCMNLESLAVPDGVDSIGKDAFAECENLYLLVKEESYAHQYALENGVIYSLDPDWL